MDKIIEFVPFLVTLLYFVFIGYMMRDVELRKKFIEAHKEKSEYSWTRVLGTFLTVSAVTIAFIQILSKQEVSYIVITSMLGIAFGTKVIQKKDENGEQSVSITKKDETDGEQ